jgi:hypothetical protein
MIKNFPIAVNDSFPILTVWDLENKVLTIRTEEIYEYGATIDHIKVRMVDITIKNWKSVWIYTFFNGASSGVESNDLTNNMFKINCISMIYFNENDDLEIIGDSEEVASLIYTFGSPEIKLIYN